MRQAEIWDEAAARRYNTAGTGMFADDVLEPTIRRLTELADGGGVLEFAIGTGRSLAAADARQLLAERTEKISRGGG